MTTEVTYDLYEAAGPRRPFVVLCETWHEEDMGEYLGDFFQEGTVFTYEGESPTWEAIMSLWRQVEKCADQAETMMALAQTPEQMDRIYAQHQQGLLEFYRDLKGKLKDVGMRFAEE